MRTGIMLDCETLGTSDSAPVVQWHMAAFNLDDPTAEIKHFGSPLPLAPQVKLGRHIGTSTALWWLRQKPEALKLFESKELEGNHDDLYGFLQASVTWLNMIAQSSFAIEIWSFGSGFDTRIFKSLLDSFDLTWPISYRAENDLRTLIALSNLDKDSVPLVDGYVKHNARFDCLQQIRWYFAAQRLLGNIE